MAAVVHQAPRQQGAAASRWSLRLLAQNVPWLHARAPGTIQRLLTRVGVRYKRGRQYLHSPDPAYAAKLRRLTGAQVLARAVPDKVVLLYEDEMTYERTPRVSRDWARSGTDAPRAALGLSRNKRRRIAACIDAISGRVLTHQRAHFGVVGLRQFYQQIAAAYPEAAVIYLAQDNWPVHTAPALQATLQQLHIERLALPTYAPWTNPVEDLWRGLVGAVLAQHAFADDWAGLQEAVSTWLQAQTRQPQTVLRLVGLSP